MLLVATLLVALLAGGAVALYVQLQGTKSAGLVKASKSSLFCAEAGVISARQTLALNYSSWGVLLDGNPSNDPTWYPVSGDLDGAGAGQSAGRQRSPRLRDRQMPQERRRLAQRHRAPHRRRWRLRLPQSGGRRRLEHRQPEPVAGRPLPVAARRTRCRHR
jgi:hypothetical protein